MKCVRCLEDKARVVAKAPDGSGAWEIYKCDHCNYAWRNTEPDTVTVVQKRNPRFQMVGVDLGKLISPCPVPALKQ